MSGARCKVLSNHVLTKKAGLPDEPQAPSNFNYKLKAAVGMKKWKAWQESLGRNIVKTKLASETEQDIVLVLFSRPRVSKYAGTATAPATTGGDETPHPYYSQIQIRKARAYAIITNVTANISVKEQVPIRFRIVLRNFKTEGLLYGAYPKCTLTLMLKSPMS